MQIEVIRSVVEEFFSNGNNKCQYLSDIREFKNVKDY